MQPDEFTQTLRKAAGGDRSAMDQVFLLVYEELRRRAAGHLRGERQSHTLQPTALAHEAYLRLIGRADYPWQSRAHFMAVAARAMRAILVDHARKRNAQKRGGGRTPERMETFVELEDTSAVRFEDLDLALQDLARLNERQARVVELRYFGGLGIEEAAEVLGVSAMTVKRDWATARAWLYRELAGTDPVDPKD
jgi:RNA polymerase sigma factor (TIGR02999 family)